MEQTVEQDVAAYTNRILNEEVDKLRAQITELVHQNKQLNKRLAFREKQVNAARRALKDQKDH